MAGSIFFQLSRIYRGCFGFQSFQFSSLFKVFNARNQRRPGALCNKSVHACVPIASCRNIVHQDCSAGLILGPFVHWSLIGILDKHSVARVVFIAFGVSLRGAAAQPWNVSLGQRRLVVFLYKWLGSPSVGFLTFSSSSAFESAAQPRDGPGVFFRSFAVEQFPIPFPIPITRAPSAQSQLVLVCSRCSQS